MALDVLRHLTAAGQKAVQLAQGVAFGLGRFSSLPTASADWRSGLVVVEGGPGVADRIVLCSKDAADAYAWRDVEVGLSAKRVLYVPWVLPSTFTGADLLWTNMPAAEALLWGFGSGPSVTQRVDLRAYAEVRLHTSSGGAIAGAKLRLTFSTDNAAWNQLGASGQVEAALTTGATVAQTTSGWVALAAGAKIEDCYLRVTGLSGNGVNDPLITVVAAEFR